MKKTLLFTALLFIAANVFSQAKETTVSGIIQNAAGKKIFLGMFEKNYTIKIDSTVVSKKGKYSFKRKLDKTDFYLVSLVPSDYVVLILTPGEKVVLNADGTSMNKSYTQTGSVHSQKLKDFIDIVNGYVAKRDSLQAKVTEFASKGDQMNASKTNKLKEAAFVEFTVKRDKFLDDNLESPAILGVLNHINTNADLAQLKKIELGLSKSMPGSQYHESVKLMVTQLELRLAEQERQRKEQAELAGRISPGKEAPEIVMNDINGKPIALSSLKGKVVLIDFWASWCGPCRKENPNVVKLYNKYKDKGFTVYSVSLDRPGDKAKWLGAIEADNLLWENHVSSLQGWETPILRTYGISSIPFTVLIDKEGKIVQVNLRGLQLEDALAKIFGE